MYTATSAADGFKQYIGLMASDLSLYEMSSAQAEAGGGRTESCRGARFMDIAKDGGREGMHPMYEIPFIHRTSLETSWMTEDRHLPPTPAASLSSSTSGMTKSGVVDMNSVLSRSRHRALGVRVLLSEEPSQHMPSPSSHQSRASAPLGHSHMLSLKSTHIHISLRDMTYRFDPLSRWFNRIPELFTGTHSPAPPPSPNDTASTVSVPAEFSKTRISISVQKLLVDFCQPKLTAYEGAESRLLLSIGKLQLSSTLVSNSPRVGFKFSMDDLSVRIGNRLLRNNLLEQSPIDVDGRYIEEYLDELTLHTASTPSPLPLDLDTFLDAHGIVTMGSIDHLECRLDLNSTYRLPPSSPVGTSGEKVSGEHATVVLSFEATAGTCYFYGCADSMHLLAVGTSR